MWRKNVVAEEVTQLGYDLMRQDQRIVHIMEETKNMCHSMEIEAKWNKNQSKMCGHSVLLHLPLSPGSREDFLPLCSMKSSAVEQSRPEISNESCSSLTIQVIRIYTPFYSNVANTFLATKACKEWSGFSVICLLLRRGFWTFAVPQSQTLSMLSAFVAFSTVSNIHAGPAAAARVRFLMPGGLDGYRHFMLLPSQFSR